MSILIDGSKVQVKTKNEFSYKKVKKIPFEIKGRNRKKGTPRYLRDFFTFDIETTNIIDLKQSVMYIWQMFICGEVIYGRKWKDFIFTIEHINNNIPDNCRMICFVHNLSFEFMFIKAHLHFEDVFISRKNVILKAVYKKIEFRCSYMLTNNSLLAFTKKMGVVTKLSGEQFNYNKTRFFNSKLNEFEYKYAFIDVICLYKALKKFITLENETLYTLPLTSTGFVRREVKDGLKKTLPFNYSKNRQFVDINKYNMARNAFRGGNVHGNKLYQGKILNDVFSVDIKSSYPAQLLNKSNLYPMGIFSKIARYTKEELLYMLANKKNCMIIKFDFCNLYLKNPFNPVPYIPISKVENPYHYLLDNGRVISMKSGTFYCTNIDLEIIFKQYDFQMDNIYITCAKGGLLPLVIKDTIKKYFTLKETINKTQNPGEYARSKEKLNSIYGVMVSDILNDKIEYKSVDFDLHYDTFTVKQQEPEKELLKNAHTNPLLYQWGIFCTAYARKQLQDILDIFIDTDSIEDFVYCDTDSIKGLNYEKYKPMIEQYNISIKSNIPIEYTYKNKIMGVYEYEGTAERFKFISTKKYVYEDKGNLNVVIAGVNKVKGKKELLKAGGLDALKEGFVFKEAGGAEGRYNNIFAGYKYKNKLYIEITDNVYLQQHEYTLSITTDYKSLIEAVMSGEYVDNYKVVCEDE